jgi:hypothetical protein
MPVSAAPSAPQGRAGHSKPLVSHRVSDSPHAGASTSGDGSARESSPFAQAAQNGTHAAEAASASLPQHSSGRLGSSASQPSQGDHGNGDSRPATAAAAAAADADPQRSEDARLQQSASAAAEHGPAIPGDGQVDAGSAPSRAATAASDVPAARGLSALSREAAADLHGGTPSSNMSFGTLDSSSAPGRCPKCLWRRHPSCLSCMQRLQFAQRDIPHAK